MRLLPRGLSSGLKKVAGEFARGVWDGMSPGQKKPAKKTSKGRRAKR